MVKTIDVTQEKIAHQHKETVIRRERSKFMNELYILTYRPNKNASGTKTQEAKLYAKSKAEAIERQLKVLPNCEIISCVKG